MEILSKVLMWSGSVLIYIGWLYGELDWKFYRYKKSLIVFIGYVLWTSLIVLLLIKMPIFSTLLIFIMNMVYSFLFIRFVTEGSGKNSFKYSAMILFLGFIGYSLYIRLCDLGSWLKGGRTELLPDIVILLFMGVAVAIQKILLEQGKAYKRKQRDREKQLIEMMTFKESMEFQEKQYAEMAEVYDEIRKIRHDIRNSFMVIEGLLEQGRIDEARKYLNSESEEMDRIPPIIQTESVVISTLLNRIY